MGTGAREGLDGYRDMRERNSEASRLLALLAWRMNPVGRIGVSPTVVALRAPHDAAPPPPKSPSPPNSSVELFARGVVTRPYERDRLRGRCVWTARTGMDSGGWRSPTFPPIARVDKPMWQRHPCGRTPYIIRVLPALVR